MAFLAGYNVRLVNIIQGLSQLEHHYGSARDSILQNSSIQVYFAANDDTTARYISARLGTKTIRTASRSDPGGFGWATKTSGYASRDLMLPEEVRQLKNTKQVVFKEGARPIKTNRIRYYQDRAFKGRLLPAAPVPTLDMTITPPPAPWLRNDASIANPKEKVDDNNESTAEPFAEQSSTKEIEAMGLEIADLMADEADLDAQLARDHLSAVIHESLDR